VARGGRFVILCDNVRYRIASIGREEAAVYAYPSLN
jgi:hypothetical protein